MTKSVQWTGDFQVIENLVGFDRIRVITSKDNTSYRLYIKTTDGMLHIEPGHWVVKMDDGTIISSPTEL